MANLMKRLNKYIGKYLSTRIVFALDIFVSLASSLITLVLATIFSEAELLEFRPLVLWMGTSFLSSFFLIWGFRTYRIIIRHTTLREFGRFVLVALCKSLIVGFVYAMTYTRGYLLFMLMLTDFFMTFAGFLFVRMAMLMAYDIVMGKMNYRRQCQNVLVYGVGVKSVALLPRLQNSNNYNIVGFLQYGSCWGRCCILCSFPPAASPDR